jgi:hypothetical protein
VSEIRYLRKMTGGVPVVTAPPEIDITTADEFRAVLLDTAARGHATVVVDLTLTRSVIPAGCIPCCERTSWPGQAAASCGWSRPLTAWFLVSLP